MQLVEHQSDGTSEDDQNDAMKTESEARYRYWMAKNRDLIQIFLEFGVSNALANRLPKLLGAEMTFLILRRNLQKYTKIES